MVAIGSVVVTATVVTHIRVVVSGASVESSSGASLVVGVSVTDVVVVVVVVS